MKKNFNNFSRFLYKTIINSTSAFIIILIVLVWFVIGGFYMHFSHEWFFILEGFAISITLIMTFVIEHTQRADTRAIQEKLDELIKKSPKTDNKKVGIEKKYKGER